MNEFLRYAVGTVCLLTAFTNAYLLLARFMVWRWTNTKSNSEAFEILKEIRSAFLKDGGLKTRLENVSYLSNLSSTLDVEKLEYIGRHFKKHDYELMALIYSVNKVTSSSAAMVRERRFWVTCSVTPPPLTYDEHQLLETIHKELFSVYHQTQTFKMSYGKLFNSDGMRLSVMAVGFLIVSIMNFVN